MVGRIVAGCFVVLVGLSGMRVEAQAPVESAPACGSGCAPCVPACVPAKPCRPCMFGPGLRGLFGCWCRPCKCQPPVACATCAPAPCKAAQPVCVTTPRCQSVPVCVVQRPPVVAKVVVNCAPAPCYVVPAPCNTVGVAAQPAPRHAVEPTTAAPPMAPAVNPYVAFMDSVQTNQEKDARALQEMVERRQANLAVIRSMQTADANSVAAFEKLARQMKEDSAKENPEPAKPAAPAVAAEPTVIPPPPVATLPAAPVVPPAPPAAPVVVTPPVIAPAPAAAPTGPSPREIQALMEELDRLSRKVKELSAPAPGTSDN